MLPDEDSDSNIDIKTALPKKITKKQPKSPSVEHLRKEPRKLTTREMIHSALLALKSRKGTSLQAIKKFIVENYVIDAGKINFLIKKSIKAGVETGTIVQVKGAGASGSFKLGAVEKTKPKIKKKIEKKDKTTKEKVEKTDKANQKAKPKSEKEKPKEKAREMKKSAETKTKQTKVAKESKVKKLPKETKSTKETEKAVKQKKKSKDEELAKKSSSKQKTKTIATPLKKSKNIAKRKSIGSIIKPPKMKPKMRVD